MNDEREPGSNYPKELLVLLQANNIYDVKWEKQKAVWDGNNQYSVVRVIAEKLSDMFLPLSGGEEGTSVDYSYAEERVHQVLEKPLAYIKEVCSSSTKLGIIGGLFVSYGGITNEEAKQIVSEALALINHKRQDLERILELPGVAKGVLQMLNSSVTSQQEEERITEMVRTTQQSVPLDQRKN